MGKTRKYYAAPARGHAKRNPGYCLGCHKRIIYGERCPPCATDVRINAAKRKRKR